MTKEDFTKENLELFLMKAGTNARVYSPKHQGFKWVTTKARENLELVEDGTWAIDKFGQDVKDFLNLAHDLADAYKNRTRSLSNCQFLIEELNVRWLCIMDTWQMLNPFLGEVFSKVLAEIIEESQAVAAQLEALDNNIKEEKENEDLKI